MNNQLKKLTEEELSLLIEAPVLVSLLAMSQDGIMDNTERNDAVEMSHFRTYTSAPDLRSYYKLVESSFNSKLNKLAKEFAPLDVNQKSIENRLKLIFKVLEKLDSDYSLMMKDSLKSYAKHVASSHPKFCDYFDFSNFQQ